MTQINGAQVLLAPGQYGDQIDARQIGADGSLGPARALTLSGGTPGAVTALEELHIAGEHIFITASRHAPGLAVWTRDGDTLSATGQADAANFLATGAVQAMALAAPGGVPYLLAASVADDDFLAFRVLPGGGLGLPTRLDLRDGLFVDTPTQIARLDGGMTRAEVVQGFSQSAEFVRDTAQDVATWVRAQGVDDIISGGGNDVLAGGGLSDTFVFDAAPGNSTILDLELWDTLDLTAMHYGSLAAARADFSQQESDVVFDNGDGTYMTLLNTDLATLSDDMFLF